MLIPRNHARKIWPQFVGAILRGEKAFELRQEDRARFEPGLSLQQQERRRREHEKGQEPRDSCP